MRPRPKILMNFILKCGVVLWGHFKDTNPKSLVMNFFWAPIKSFSFLTNWCFIGTFWDIQAQGAASRHQLSDLGLSKLLYYIIIELEKKKPLNIIILRGPFSSSKYHRILPKFAFMKNSFSNKEMKLVLYINLVTLQTWRIFTKSFI